MINSKPVICVTGSTNNAVFPEATREIQMTMTYCDAIYGAGGVPSGDSLSPSAAARVPCSSVKAAGTV